MIPSERRNFGRRDFLKAASWFGAASLFGPAHRAAAEPPPETTRLRLFATPLVSCIAPHYVAEELLRREGFTDVQFVTYPSETQIWPPDSLLTGEVDISLSFPPTDLTRLDAGAPIVILGGSHSGCVELFGGHRVRSTLDLKGKTAAVFQLGTDDHVFISMFAAYVGLDPRKDINWVVYPYTEHPRLLAEGKIDAFMGGPPRSLEIRERKIGRVLVNTTTDKPWSDYFCCLVACSKEFVTRNPVATKRALRAFLKANDVCAAEPYRVARMMAEKGLARYDYALQTLRELSYGKWREFDPEDALRFYALRMHDAGMIKSTPQKLIAQGTDWRFWNELKRELKA